jgi:sugar/nucleoside kinase (ribokinase family)
MTAARPPRSRFRVVRPTVVGLGLCVVDHLYVVDDLAGTNERTRYTRREVLAGGMVSNALSQVARLGCRAELICWSATTPTGAGSADCARAA